MADNLFIPGDILLPKNTDMTLWSVPACDQFTSEPEYWDRVDRNIGENPSTLRMMLPEAYFRIKDTAVETEKVLSAMNEYLGGDVFAELKGSYIYIERAMLNGDVRRGILGLVDLENYDYSPDAKSPVRATEATVESRLPARAKLRESAAVELTHILMLVDDPGDRIMKAAETQAGEILYDFDLMEGGGHICGRIVNGAAADEIKKMIDDMSGGGELAGKYGNVPENPVILAIGDGNHSLAAAKLNYEKMKAQIGAEAALNCIARYALAELVNVRDEAVSFHPIHRLVAETDTADFLNAAAEFWKNEDKGDGTAAEVLLKSQEKEVKITVRGLNLGSIVDAADRFCTEYIKSHGGKPDFIHGEDVLLKLSSKDGCCGMLLPEVDKGEFFKSVMEWGPLPRKSFSIGEAQEKRYYLECRKIK